MNTEDLIRMFGNLVIRKKYSFDSDSYEENSGDKNFENDSDDSGPDRRKFGSYRCPSCNREWESANSWRDYGQKCQKCNITVMAYKRSQLLKSNNIDTTKEHPREFCEKCRKLGRSCRTL